MSLVGFETTISAGKRLQTYTLDCAATGTGTFLAVDIKNPALLIIIMFANGHNPEPLPSAPSPLIIKFLRQDTTNNFVSP
jgi:hypothetical protein